jgi:hypothetical protein
VERLEKFFPLSSSEQEVAVIGPGNFAHEVFALQDHRELAGFVMAAEGLMTDRDCEKTGEAVGLVVSGRLQVAPEWFRAHIDTENCLGLRPDRAGAGMWARTCCLCVDDAWLDWRRELEPEAFQQLFLIAGFKCFQPERAMLGFGETIDPCE